MTEGGSDEPERERLVSTECRSCGAAIVYGGTGRWPRYCSSACRQRGWALRQAEQRLTHDDPRPHVVRETVARERMHTIRVAGKAPSEATPWANQLDVLRRQLRGSEYSLHADIHRDTTQPQRLAYALSTALAALDAAHPGAIDWRPLPTVVRQPAESHPSRPAPSSTSTGHSTEQPTGAAFWQAQRR